MIFVVVLLVVAVAGQDSLSKVTIRTGVGGKATINCTDDVDSASLTWTAENEFVFSDKVKLNGTLVTGTLDNSKYTQAMSDLENILACNEQQKLWDKKTGKCATGERRVCRSLCASASHAVPMLTRLPLSVQWPL